LGLTLVVVVVVVAATVLTMAVVVAVWRQRRRSRALLMRQRFLAALGHELRTPLNAMAGSVSLLQSSSAEARQQAMSVIERNVRIEATLIDELCDQRASSTAGGVVRALTHPSRTSPAAEAGDAETRVA
jgi:signal transduction histidine kinase